MTTLNRCMAFVHTFMPQLTRQCTASMCVLTALMLPFGSAQAQGQVALVVDRNPVVAGQAFRLTFEFKDVSAQLNNPPAIVGLRYLSGPSTSSNTQILNGAVSSKKSFTYSVVAEKAGMLTIPRLEFRTRKGLLRTEQVNLKVLNKGSGSGKPAAQFEAVIEVNKRAVHIGEALRVQYRIYNRMDAVDVRNYSFPELSGAWKETVEGEDPRWETTIVDGRRVQVATVRTDILYPTRTGSLEINGFDVEAQQRVSFFNSRPISATAKTVNIEVRPLPPPVPAASLGTFGQLSLTWKASGADNPMTNNALNLTLEFKGKGNLPLIGAPDIQWPKDLEVFDPEIEDRITTDLQGQRGRRTMTYLVIPRAEGQYEIALPEMAFFDHTLDRFVSLTTAPIALDVKGDGQQDGPSFGFNSKTDVTILTRDMRFIRTETELTPQSRPFFGGLLHMSMWAFPPILLAMGAAWRRRKDKEDSDPALLRKRRAKAAIKLALSKAKKGEVALDALGQAAHEFLQSQLEIPRSDAGMQRYRDALKSCPVELAERWLDVLATLDQGRFAPGAPKPADIAERLETASRDLEKCARRPLEKGTTTHTAVIALLLALLPTALSAAPNAASAQAQFQAGNAAYLEGDFETALALYEEVAVQWSSFELEYNLGVAYYKSGQIGPSILHFERAKRIRPSDDDLQANMLLAKSAVVDRIENMPEVALEPLWRELTSEHRLKAWTVSSLLIWALASLLFLLRMRSTEIATRRSLLIAGPALGVIALFLGFMSRETFLRGKADDGAVIMSPRIEVRSSPTDGTESSNLFVLHEGTVVEILREEGEWLQIRLANGNAGWVQAPVLAPI